MATSAQSLSSLAKGTGQVSKNGHEKLDVILEAEDYIPAGHGNQSLNQLARRKLPVDENDQLPLHKTYITRKGALLLFSEELASREGCRAINKNTHKSKRTRKDVSWMNGFNAAEIEDENGSIKTCHDLSWAILSYGSKPRYRRRGEELYLKFVHQNRKEVRNVRPGFSPKRYISTLANYWDQELLEKMMSDGMMTQWTENVTNTSLSHHPAPYRATPNHLISTMQFPSDISYQFYSLNDPGGRPNSRESLENGETPGLMTSEQMASRILSSRAMTPPPSEVNSPRQENPDDDEDEIQALRYDKHGNIEQVSYSKLETEDRENILAELLIAAHEHQRNITSSGSMTSSHKGEQLKIDMNQAIKSLISSPVKQQMKERQQLEISKKKNATTKPIKQDEDSIISESKVRSSTESTENQLTKNKEPETNASKNEMQNTRLSDEALMTSYFVERDAEMKKDEEASNDLTRYDVRVSNEKPTPIHKPILFQPPISMHEVKPNARRKGAMPISSNIVRQTLAGKLSILSSSRSYDEVSLPSITNQLQQVNSTTTNTNLQKDKKRHEHEENCENNRNYQQNGNGADANQNNNDNNTNNNGGDENHDQYTTDEAARGSHKSSKSIQTMKSRSLRTKLVPVLPTSEKQYLRVELPSFSGMRGGKALTASGSPTSSATMTKPSNVEPKKHITNIKRRVNPQGGNHAASVLMPDGEVISIGGSINSSYGIKDKPMQYDDDRSMNLNSARRVSFLDEKFIKEIDDENRKQSANDETRTSFSSLDSRPTSTASQQLVEHAKKIASMVVKQQRPNSRLEDDAKRAAEMWNDVLIEQHFETNNSNDDQPRTLNNENRLVKIPQVSTEFDYSEEEMNKNADKTESSKSPTATSSKRNSLLSGNGDVEVGNSIGDAPIPTQDRRSSDVGSIISSSGGSRHHLHVDLHDKYGNTTSQQLETSMLNSQNATSSAGNDVIRKSSSELGGGDHFLKVPSETSPEKRTKSSSKPRKGKGAKSSSGKSSKSKRNKKQHKLSVEDSSDDFDTPGYLNRGGVEEFESEEEFEDSDVDEEISKSTLGGRKITKSIQNSKSKSKKSRRKKQDPETQVEKLRENSDGNFSVAEDENPANQQRKLSTISTNGGSALSETYQTPSESAIDEYDYVRVDDEFDEDELEDEIVEERERYDTKQDMLLKERILKSGGRKQSGTGNDDVTATSGGAMTEEQRARLIAAKKDRMSKRAAAAEKRKAEVERKRREKDEAIRKEKEEAERKEQMKEQLEEERRLREEEQRRKKEEMELEKLKQQEEEENKRRKAEQFAERERRMEEEKRRKREEIQKQRREEEERRRELQRLKEEEEAERKRQEEELLAQMEEDERIKYQEKLRKEKEEADRIEHERKMKEEEEIRKAMEFARKQAIIRAHEQAILQQKLEFVKNLKSEGEKLGHALKLSKAYQFSYFELLKFLGLNPGDQLE